MPRSQSHRDHGLRVFVSYSRHDMAAADALVVALEQHGIDVRIDRRDLPYGQKWQAELAEFIREADTVVWLVSRHSVASKWCNWELGEVVRLNKRLIPVSIADVRPDELPEAIGEIHLLPADGTFNLQSHLGLLTSAIETDGAWLKEHTRLADRARQWIAKDRNTGLLLRGAALADSEAWADRQPTKAPSPSDDILSLILTSRRAASRRLRISLAAALCAAALAGGLGFFAEVNRREANVQRDFAAQREKDAVAQRDRALITESQFLAELSVQKARAGDPRLAALLALEALPHADTERPYVAEAERSLYGALHSDRKLLDLIGHAGEVRNAAYSRNGRQIVTASADKTAVIWDADLGKQAAVLRHSEAVERAYFSPLGSHVVTMDEGGALHIWEATSGRLVTRLATDYSRMVGGRAIAVGTAHVAVGTETGKVLVLDITSGRVAAEIKAHKNTVSSIAISADGRRLASASEDGSVAVWELRNIAANRAPLYRITDKDSRGFVSVSFNMDGTRLLTLMGSLGDWRRSDINKAAVWDQTGKLVTELAGHEFRIMDAAFSPNGQSIVTVGGEARLWSADGRFLSLLNHGGEVAAFTQDGTRVVIGNSSEAKVFLVASGRQIAHIAFGSNIIPRLDRPSLDPSGRRFVGVSGQRATVWDASARYPMSVPNDALFPEGDAEDTTVSPDGQSILYQRYFATKNDPTPPAELWNGRAGSLVSKFTVEPSFSTSQVFSSDGLLVAVGCDICEKPWVRVIRAADAANAGSIPANAGLPLAFSADGKWLLTGQDNVAIVYEVASGRKLVQLAGHTEKLHFGEFSVNGERLVTRATGEDTARLWDLRSGRQLHVFGEKAKPVSFAAFSPDGASIVTASKKIAEIWSASFDRPRLSLDGHAHHIESARFSPSGGQIVTSSVDRTAIIWDVRSGRQVVKLEGHQRGVKDATFSPDGTRILTVSSDHTTRLWDTRSGANIGVLAWVENGGNVFGRFSTTGDAIYMATEDHTALRLPAMANTAALIEHMRQFVPTCLAPAERKTYNLVSAPPRWCITGPGLEQSKTPSHWRPKPPYDDRKWVEWLYARDRGEITPMPPMLDN